MKKLIIRLIILVLVSLSFKLVLSSVPIITISGIEEGSYYSTAVYPEISILDTNLSYSTVTLKFKNSADSAYVSGTEIKKDGWYRLFTSACDSTGNTSYESVNFVIDKSKPAISIVGVSNNAYYSTDIWFKVKISETNPVKEDITFDGNACSENETVWVNEEGLHKLIVDTLDKAGNVNMKEYNFTVDKTLPLINISGVEDNQYYTSFIAPQISIIDANYDSGGITIALNGETFINGTEIKEDGDFVLNVIASDLALNKSEKKIHFELKVSPQLSVITRPGGAAVYLDGDYSLSGQYQGLTTSGDEGELIIKNNLSCGKHLLKIKKPGYVDHIELMDFGIGELIEKNIDLILCKNEYFYEGQLLDLDSANISLRPWVADYDQDSKKDLVVRTSGNKDYLYLNTGEDNIPEFDSGALINSEGETFFEIFYESSIQSPASSIKGSSDGKIYFDSSIIILADSTEIDVGGHSWPFVFDFDHDGKDDLISGAQNGKVYFFKNIESQENPLFDSARLIQTGSKDLDIGGYSRPFVVDWNNDDLYDLLIGSSGGVYLFLAADKKTDDTAPVTTAETTPAVFPDKWINSDVEIKLNAIDDLSGFDSAGGTYYSFDSVNWSKGNEVLLTDEGNFGLFYYSVDDAGNQETAKQIKINIDKTLPVIANLIIPDINEHTNISINISADINDELSGLDTTLYQYSLNQDTTWTNFHNLILDWKNLTGKVICFRIYAKDKAGNERYSEQITEPIENINDKPEITSYMPDAKSLHIKEGEKIDFKVEAFDADYDSLALTWYFDSSAVSVGNLEWTYHADYNDSGKHEIRFTASDPILSVEEKWEVDVADVLVRPPLKLVANTGTSGYVFLKWDKNKYFNLLGYNIYRENTKINKTLVTKDSYSDTGLIDETQYLYFIRAVDINGKESENSNEVTVIPEDLFAPSIPANLDISNSGLLSWDSPEAEDSDLAGYYLYKVTSAPLPAVEGEHQLPVFENQLDIGDVNTYQLTGLLPGTQYYFAISAYDNHNKESEKSNIVSFIFYDTQPPSQVKGVRIRDTGKTGELKIKWLENSEPDISGYKIYYSLKSSEYNAPLFVSMKEKFVLSGLVDFIKYFIAVSAVDTQGNEGLQSNEEIGIPRCNLTFIPSPDPLRIDPINKGVKLSWNSVAGVDGYKLYFGRSEDLVIAPLITSDTTFVFSNLSNNNKYYAAVSSFKDKDESERVSSIVFPKDELTPDAPAGLTCLSGNDGTSLILSWSMNKEWDLAGYKIAYKTNQEYFSDPVKIGKINKFDIKGLIGGEQYTIVLFAYDVENNTSNPSIVTGIPLKTNYTYNDPPSAPLPDISCENGSVRLNWTTSGSNIDEYRIYRREAGDLKYKKIYQTKNLTYKNKAVEEGRTYYYVVTAFNGSSFPKESIFSNEVVMRPRLEMGDIEIEGDVPVAGRVDGYDLIMLSLSFGSRVGDDYYNPNADLNGDGIIDGIDLSILANNFGRQY